MESLGKLLFIVAGLSLLVACSSPRYPGIDKVSPPPAFLNLSDNYTLPRIPEKWWELFGLPELNRLVEEVLKENHDLRKARFRIAELQARLKEKYGERWPSVTLQFGGRRGRQTLTGGQSYPGASRSYFYGEFQGELLVSYEVDLWQRLSSAQKAAFWEVLAAEEDRLALAQSLVARTVTLYLEALFLSCEKDILSQEIHLREKRYHLLSERYRQGLISARELLLEEEELLRARNLLPELSQNLKDRLQELELLAGNYPAGQKIKLPKTTCALNLPPPPAGLPSELLKRRPDIRAAEARVKAAAQRVRVARAARFPSLVLTVERGQVSTALKELLQPENRFWWLAFQASQTLFSAGRLKAQEEAARKILAQSEEEYRQTVLQAFREVEYGLYAEQEIRQALNLTQERLRNLRLLERFSEKRSFRGLVPIPDYLSQAITVKILEREALRLRKALLLNRVFLYRALGGGFHLPEEGESS